MKWVSSSDAENETLAEF